MSNTISILIKAQDNASKSIKNIGDNIESAGNKSEQSSGNFEKFNGKLLALAGISATAGLATRRLYGFMDEAVGTANDFQAALTGLNRIATAFSQDAQAAERAASDLASDGLMSVADAATGLKNLLAAGFNLDDATTLMKRFKDSAAFGRQSALGFGQAIASATEGIKNGNSILVDNAGVTKNLSMMLTEAGYSAQDLMKASTDAGVRQAIFNGILKETNAQAGDAAALAESAAGKQAVWSAQTEQLKARIGEALQPALLRLLETVTPIIEKIATWVEQNPELASGLLIGVTAVMALTSVLGAAGTAITAVHTLFGGLSAAVSVPIVMPAIAVAAAIAALMAVIAKHQETQRVIEETEAHIARVNQASADVDAAVKKRFEDGKITQQAYQTYLYNTRRVADQMARETERQYSGVFGWINRKLDELSGRTINTSTSIGGGAGGGGFAQGTSYAPGGWTWVGERGPELVRLPTGSQVMQNYRSQQVASEGGGGDTHITISGTINIATPEAAESFWNRIDQTQRLAKVGMA